jgi:hypothetical protein
MWLPNVSYITSLNVWGYAWHSFPFFIKICFAISVIALTGILLAVTSIIARRTSKKSEEEKRSLISSRINDMLLQAVVLDKETNGLSNSKKKFDIGPLYKLGLTPKKVKQILVTEMLCYRNNFSGTIADRVRMLYISLGLHKEAMVRLHKKNWEVKVNALAQLFKMDVAVDHSYLVKLVEDHNRYIREYARLSLMKFTKEDPLELLRELNEPISQWQEFEIFLLFQEKKNYTPGSMEGLISLDKEPTVVSLCLQLAVYFKQQQSVPLIIALIETSNLKLRAEAITALGKLEAQDAAKHLVHIYLHQPQEIKLAILTALGRIRSGRYLNFLEDEFIVSDDFEIKKYASDAIIKLYPLSKTTIDNLMDNRETLNQRILNHSLNPLINSL